jgi:DNA-binding CsgD family transcriptional regulator
VSERAAWPVGADQPRSGRPPGLGRTIALGVGVSSDGLAWLPGFGAGNIADGLAAARAAVVAAERVDEPAGRARGLTAVGVSQVLMGDRAGVGVLRRAETAGGGLLLSPFAGPRAWVGMRELWLGHLRLAREVLEIQLGVAQERGAEVDRVWLLVALAQAELVAGCAGAASERLLEARALVGANGGQAVGLSDCGGLWLRAVGAELLAVSGDERRGRVEAAEVVSVSAVCGDWLAQASAGLTLARLELWAGESVRARWRLAGLVGELERRGLREPGVFRVGPELVEALLGVGDVRSAEVEARVFCRRVDALRHSWGRVAAGRCLALVALGRGEIDVAVAGLARACVGFDGIEHRFEAARAVFELGVALVRAGRRRLALRAFGDAVERFGVVGAGGWQRRAREAAERVDGVRRPAGQVGLTPSEERIAELVVAGCSNKEIAARVRSTVGAVEAHLSRAYRKLGVRSRGQLVALARDSGLPLTTITPVSR